LTADLSPLIQCAGLLTAQFVAWRTVPSELRALRLTIKLALFTAYSIVLFRSELDPLHAAPWGGDPVRHLIAQVLELAWWYLGARLATLIANSLFFPQLWQKERLFEDVLGAMIFLAASIAAVAYVLELPVRGLLATSGAVAIVVGLAVQSTLSDVFSGIVLNATRPYQLGDLISVDGVDGKVIETSWRATQLLNSAGDVVTVPNTLAAKVKIVNLSRPNALHGVSVLLHVSPEARPTVVIEALQRAMLGCDLALQTPASSVAAVATDINSIVYELTCYVSELSKAQDAKNQLFDLAFRHLAAAQVALRPLGYPERAALKTTLPERLLARVEIFKPLSAEEITELAAQSMRYDVELGAILIKETDVADYLMVIASGVLSVHEKDACGELHQLCKLGPGDSLGESGVLTGVSLNVRVVADTNVTVYKLNKSALTPLLKSNPDVARRMCSIIAKRQSVAEQALHRDVEPKKIEGIFQRIWDGMRSFHVLGD
jgi:small-conductance mechanosensitive channel/CRP-like cAMP-binding protein